MSSTINYAYISHFQPTTSSSNNANPSTVTGVPVVKLEEKERILHDLERALERKAMIDANERSVDTAPTSMMENLVFNNNSNNDSRIRGEHLYEVRYRNMVS